MFNVLGGSFSVYMTKVSCKNFMIKLALYKTNPYDRNAIYNLHIAAKLYQAFKTKLYHVSFTSFLN